MIDRAALFRRCDPPGRTELQVIKRACLIGDHPKGKAEGKVSPTVEAAELDICAGCGGVTCA